VRRFYAFFSSSRFVGPTLLAALIGVATSICAILFIRWIEICHEFYFGRVLEVFVSLGGVLGQYSVMLIPACGAILVGFIVVYMVPEAKGHGVPEVMKAIVLQGGRIRPIVVVAKAVASAIAIGSGASVGREGPIVQVGSALGSGIGQLFKLSESRIKNLVACGDPSSSIGALARGGNGSVGSDLE